MSEANVTSEIATTNPVLPPEKLQKRKSMEEFEKSIAASLLISANKKVAVLLEKP